MRRALVLIFAAPFAAAFVAACGMVTGLSDDFTFDGGEGGSSAGDSGGATDGAGDSGGGGDATPDAKPDSGPKCSGDTLSAADDALQSASTTCRACLLNSCCAVVATCAKSGGDCPNRLSCDAQCSTRNTTSSRTACMQSCQTDKASILFSQTVEPCAHDNCGEECGFL